MKPLLSLESSSTESDDFYAEHSSDNCSPARNSTPAVLNSTQLSGAMARHTITIYSVALLEPHIVTIDSDSSDPTTHYGFGSQHQIVPPSLKDFNLPPHQFNVLTFLSVIRADEEYSPQSLEPSTPSPISTPPMNVSTIEGWETTHTTYDATFHTDDEPKRVFWEVSSDETFDSSEPRHVSIDSSLSSTPLPPRRQKRKLSIGMSFHKKKGVSQHTCEACCQPLPAEKTPGRSGKTQILQTVNQTLTIIIICIFSCCAHIWIRI